MNLSLSKHIQLDRRKTIDFKTYFNGNLFTYFDVLNQFSEYRIQFTGHPVLIGLTKLCRLFVRKSNATHIYYK